MGRRATAPPRRGRFGSHGGHAATVPLLTRGQKLEIHLRVTCLGQADVVNAWVPIAGLAIVAVVLWVVVALDR